MKWYKDKQKQKTNFQRITASPEALAEFIGSVLGPCSAGVYRCHVCPLKKHCSSDNTFKETALEWLKQESTE